jgi:hypothetical protein
MTVRDPVQDDANPPPFEAIPAVADIHRSATLKKFGATLLRHPEWLGWAAFILALLLLIVRLGSADDATLGKWISADTLYPVNVFVDVFRDHFSISGWRFSIAPCWFPDLIATGVFWGITGNPILATLLGGFIQIPAIVLSFHMLARALGIRMLFLQDVLLLACGAALTLYVAARPEIGYPYFFEFFLPQTHVGSMVLVLAGWGMALQNIRDARQARPLRPWFMAVYATLCGLAGMSNVLFFAHMLFPLTVAISFAGFLGLVTFRQCWVPVVGGWLAAAVGAILNRALFNASDVGIQSSIGFKPAMTALEVFVHGFVSRLLARDALHVSAVFWAIVCVGYIAWFLRGLAMRGTSRMTDSRLLTAIFFMTCLTSGIFSAVVIIAGGSNGLVQFKDYVWSMHYLHQAFLLPVFGLIAAAAWICSKVLNFKAAAVLAWSVAIIMLMVSVTRLMAAPKPAIPIYAYRPPLVSFVDGIAQEKKLHYGYAGYWQARLITLLSKTGVRAYALDGSMNPLLWVNNSEWYGQSMEDRTKPPRATFVILDDPLWKLTREAAVRAFGEPYEETQFNGTRILIYKEMHKDATDVNVPLTLFSEGIDSSVKMLDLRPGEKTSFPVVLRNTGPSLWSNSGKYPITISYKWFDHGNMLPIEGKRTVLPNPLKPGDSIDLQVNIVSPGTSGEFVLKVSMVQEGVTWFMTAGAKPLELPATVH